jgi:hypothetical protein
MQITTTNRPVLTDYEEKMEKFGYKAPLHPQKHV